MGRVMRRLYLQAFEDGSPEERKVLITGSLSSIEHAARSPSAIT